MKSLKLISFFSYLLIFIPSENGSFMLLLILLVALGLFKSILSGSFFNPNNLQNEGLMLLVVVSLFCLIFSKNKYVKIASYIILCSQLIYAFCNVNYSTYKIDAINIIFSIIMPLIFVISSFFLVFKGEKKE